MFMRKNGFSLMELSISLVIIGFIVGSISIGSNIYNQSKLRSVIKEIDMINNSFNSFTDIYSSFPGDIKNPPSSWLANSGNGNSIIDIPQETSNAWHHLYKAGLINNQFSATNGSTYNLYASLYNNGNYDLRNLTAFNSGAKNGIEFGAINTAAYRFAASYSILTSRNTYYIDNKIDDGIANQGVFYGVDADDTATGNCSANYTNNSTSVINYNLSTTTVSCRIFYWPN
ncbi:MAG: prepilin-type N-terminal cleavage/methylation domain-containing protein [Rickettsiales bacterium]|nr:MAG: prepilin-type N-terminal cleavage/methylation domain-containing protein [Rickettsiales bacterium]